jgi:hypothetical protein
MTKELSFEPDDGIETIETPAVRITSEIHFLGDKDRPNIVTVKSAVVSIYPGIIRC